MYTELKTILNLEFKRPPWRVFVHLCKGKDLHLQQLQLREWMIVSDCCLTPIQQFCSFMMVLRKVKQFLLH